MQKIFLLFMLTVSVTVFSQNRFSKINSIPELRKEYQSLKESEKNMYYDRYFKLATIKDLKTQPNFSKFSDKILLDFVDILYYETDDFKSDLENESYRDDWKVTYDKVEQVHRNGQEIQLEDLHILYYRIGEYSSSQYNDIEAKNNLISYVMHVGLSGEHYNITYKVKGNKLVRRKEEKTF
ncbi:hypothetical protein SAMN05421796_10113 [Chryseobacterium piscicola]|uniref:Uncharacterized protein n=1 Tax=Chryseobacterium piscicola TaxID=551459 RepID=A0A1N7JLX2_9FLAO|nr:hypothetical protein [Chryseobacterium piscicola]PQA91391.1 hypothetical protein B0A70_13080 [Chryseobacterium piscicola]SIS50261.1 hypothetical protein SAMN05421796_10113 [Chryseobacterium piscicola]